MNNTNTSRRAFFLDRDGVVNDDHGYVFRPQDFEFIPGVFDACRQIIAHGYAIIIVTNQAGIGRGYYSESDFQHLTNWMLKEFEKQRIVIQEVCFCPHHATEALAPYLKDCPNRKPNPGMLLNAAKHNDIDLGRSVMVGDKDSDMEAGCRAGIPTLYKVKSDYGEGVKQAGVTQTNSLITAVRDFFSKGPLTESTANNGPRA